MEDQALPNLWHIYNLRESPFFQETLRMDAGARYPVELFVGRQEERTRLLRVIGSGASSRQTIGGAPGVGKTTLAQRVKAEAAQAGFLSHGHAVTVESGVDTAELLIRLLGHVYEAIMGAGGAGLKAEPVETARQLVRTFRLRSRSASLSILGIGGGGGASTRVVESGLLSPGLVVPALLRQLEEVARTELNATGIIIHVNNFENLAEADRERAASIFRDLRDVMLHEGYHYLLVGTTDALHGVLDRHPQVRSVFSHAGELRPLSPEEFATLVERRCTHLRLDPERPPLPPVAPDAVRAVYSLFQGDLRGALRALDQATHELVGYADPPTAPVGMDGLHDIRAVLAARYELELRSQLGERTAAYLHELVSVDEPFTQAELQSRWGVSKGRTSELVNQLRRFGYVAIQRRDGRQRYYRLTGAARLVLGRS